MAMVEEMTTVLEPRPLQNFVETKQIEDLTERALLYTAAGFPVHFRGGTGTGKTTLAMHVASKIGRPMVMIHGDEEFSTSDLVGGEFGYRRRKVIDNFIHTVLKTEEDMSKRWSDNRLTIACRYGFTLIYDEFTRSRPEANNVLLSVLQEKLMDAPAYGGDGGDGGGYLKVHPNFTALFTSNPEEYAGVYGSQDALRDRMVTIDLAFFDRETEVAITEARSGISRREAEKIVNIVRELRGAGQYEFAPTLRAGIMIAKSMKLAGIPASSKNNLFIRVCQDILASETSRLSTKSNQTKVKEFITELVTKHC